jgi:hypothetical protein
LPCLGGGTALHHILHHARHEECIPGIYDLLCAFTC